MRRSDSSRPSSASVSKIPGETVVPASATRSGWKTSLGLAPRALDDLAQRRLDRRSASNGSTLRERLARVGERGAAVLAQPLLARLRVVGRAVEDEARQRPEVGERLDLLLRDRDRGAQARSRPVKRLEARA